jgi:oligoribonuclease
MEQKSAQAKDPVQSASNLVWIDLEMTGLEVEVQVILQAAVIITNDRLEVLAEQAFDVWQPESALVHMTPFVRDMHQKNGLLERVKASRVELRSAESQMLATVAAWCPYGATLCGNSIWQDRRFIDKYMPGLAAYLHYRMLDVSAIKTIAQRWYPAPLQFKKPSAGEHDALVDIRNSINELRHYREKLFVAPK